jgi:hypothetical protein
MRFTSLLVLASSLLSLASAISQTSPAAAIASPDGTIVPFASKLPPCASLCGVLFDVQAACSPPVLTAPSQSCFCDSTDLSPFLQGTAGVAATCGPESCQDTASLQEILNWYDGYCNKGVPQPTGTSTTTSTFAVPTTPLISPVPSTSAAAGSALATGTSTKTSQSTISLPAATSKSANTAPSGVAGNRVAVGCAAVAGLLGWAL